MFLPNWCYTSKQAQQDSRGFLLHSSKHTSFDLRCKLIPHIQSLPTSPSQVSQMPAIGHLRLAITPTPHAVQECVTVETLKHSVFTTPCLFHKCVLQKNKVEEKFCSPAFDGGIPPTHPHRHAPHRCSVTWCVYWTGSAWGDTHNYDNYENDRDEEHHCLWSWW